MAMHRLVINPGTSAEWELELKSGANSIGRGNANDCQIDHPSISTSHCEILINPEQLWIKDLGSTNGTFIGQESVQDGPLVLGQRFRLGSIEMFLASESTSTSEAPSLPALESPRVPGNQVPVLSAPMSVEDAEHVSDKPIFCKNHYQNPGRYYCPKCARHFCDLCVNTRGSASGGMKFCKVCGGESKAVSVRAHAPKTVDFFKAVPPAFKYPFMGDGLIMLIGGSLFFGFLDVANYISRHSIAYGMRAMMMRVSIFTFILGVGYLFSFLKNVIHATAAGDDKIPDWPELSEWKADIVSPMFQFVMLSLLCFGPAVALNIWWEGEHIWLVGILALFGCCYFPMAMLGVAIFDSLTALNPLFVIGSIARVPRQYAVAALIFTGIIGMRWLAGTLLAMLIPIPLAPALISDLLGLGLLIVLARILGLLYLSQQGTLDWFHKKAPISYRQAAQN